MGNKKSEIIYTLTDEAPALATRSLLPIVRAFAAHADIEISTRDISLAGRILGQFSDYLPAEQQQSDDLAELGRLVKDPDANIIKLPNISASLPQLKAAISELQQQGHPVPDYPDLPDSVEEQTIQSRYDRIKGSAVNPVLREGNSDRRAPGAVKQYARQHPHSMGEWSKDSKSHVASMQEGDFYATEQSVDIAQACSVNIEFVESSGEVHTLKEGLALQQGDIFDAAVMQRKALRRYLATEIDAAKGEGLLLSLHLKATMMKVSDPIIFGQAVEVFFEDLFSRHGETLSRLGVNANHGLAALDQALESLPLEERLEIFGTLEEILRKRPPLAMVNSDQGITNLHVPSDVIIDASMPAMIRAGGQMWNLNGELQDTKALIPDRCYAGVYQQTIDFCRENGALDPATMGSVPNVGLMAQKAEEYGSHDKTFLMEAEGVVRVITERGETICEHAVAKGDIWRACLTHDAPVRDWVRLAVERARLTQTPAIFWLDPQRAHDKRVINKVERYLGDYDTSDLELQIMPPIEATRYSLERIKEGLDTISVTGNVLRDYLTDLFPILELGTSAKMLSIVPLMPGGGLFETGAGGSAPKHVQQLLQENHLRWDSLGEFLALAASLEHLGQKRGNDRALLLAKTLDQATSEILTYNRSPSRKVNELDNRGTHFYLALYWSQALAEQDRDPQLQSHFKILAEKLTDNKDAILADMESCQGISVDLGGYFRPNDEMMQAVMRPSSIFNEWLGRV